MCTYTMEFITIAFKFLVINDMPFYPDIAHFRIIQTNRIFDEVIHDIQSRVIYITNRFSVFLIISDSEIKINENNHELKRIVLYNRNPVIEFMAVIGIRNKNRCELITFIISVYIVLGIRISYMLRICLRRFRLSIVVFAMANNIVTKI
ncbi:hypothetical protein EOM86_11145 [Candidatus Nomurabacteria bacterium]|nr:hypothetical protein [Candidatus Nomurabacteria bacterium]